MAKEEEGRKEEGEPLKTDDREEHEKTEEEGRHGEERS